MKNSNYVRIDVDAFSKMVDSKCSELGITKREFCENVGRTHQLISNSTSRGKIHPVVLDLICKVYGVNRDSIVYHEPVKPAEPKSFEPVQNPGDVVNGMGYTLGLQMWPDKLRVAILFQGTEVYAAYSKIKGNTELDLMQAISYATHIIYKYSEQHMLNKGEQL